MINNNNDDVIITVARRDDGRVRLHDVVIAILREINVIIPSSMREREREEVGIDTILVDASCWLQLLVWVLVVVVE